MFGLNDSNSLHYIGIQTRGTELENVTITLPILWDRREKLKSEDAGRMWLHNFAKIGFILEHKTSIETAKRLIRMINNELYNEYQKPSSPVADDGNGGETRLRADQVRNETKLKWLRYDLRETLRLLDDLMRGSPALMEVSQTAQELKQIRDKLNKYGINNIDAFASKLRGLSEGQSNLPEAIG